jgi:hypothetical protein
MYLMITYKLEGKVTRSVYFKRIIVYIYDCQIYNLYITLIYN